MARLAEIDVDEVSYVDKAANKRKFLFVKRDKGGDNLELLKKFEGSKDVIEALEGITSNLEKFDAAFTALLNKQDLQAEEKERLLAKKEDFDLLKEDINERFEELFLEKATVSHDNSSGVDSEQTVDALKPQQGDEGKGMSAVKDSYRAKGDEKAEDEEKPKDEKKPEDDMKKSDTSDTFTAEEQEAYKAVLSEVAELNKDIENLKVTVAK